MSELPIDTPATPTPITVKSPFATSMVCTVLFVPDPRVIFTPCPLLLFPAIVVPFAALKAILARKSIAPPPVETLEVLVLSPAKEILPASEVKLTVEKMLVKIPLVEATALLLLTPRMFKSLAAMIFVVATLVLTVGPPNETARKP